MLTKLLNLYDSNLTAIFGKLPLLCCTAKVRLLFKKQLLKIYSSVRARQCFSTSIRFVEGTFCPLFLYARRTLSPQFQWTLKKVPEPQILRLGAFDGFKARLRQNHEVPNDLCLAVQFLIAQLIARLHPLNAFQLP